MKDMKVRKHKPTQRTKRIADQDKMQSKDANELDDKHEVSTKYEKILLSVQ